MPNRSGTQITHIYLDYNLIAIAGGKTRPDAELPERRLIDLRERGDSLVLSAWHALELSRSNEPDHIEGCIDLVERLDPVWLSNPSYVKTEELKKFIATEMGLERFQSHPNPAFDKLVSQMWSTYGDAFVGETFANTVRALQSGRGAQEIIDKAVNQSMDAIRVGRETWKDGRMKSNEAIIDRAYFASLAPRSSTSSDIDKIADKVSHVIETCPAIAVEDHLTRIRATESFVPTRSDAIDSQHATIAVAYCDYFVSDDKMLMEQCKRVAGTVGVNCVPLRRPMEIP